MVSLSALQDNIKSISIVSLSSDGRYVIIIKTRENKETRFCSRIADAASIRKAYECLIDFLSEQGLINIIKPTNTLDVTLPMGGINHRPPEMQDESRGSERQSSCNETQE